MHQKIVADTTNAINWFEANSIKANPEKFQTMSLGYKVDNFTIQINNVTLIDEDYVKLLGMYIDKNLSFNK